MQKKFNIREERLKLGLTQEVLAKSLEITPEYLSMLENGKKPISEKVLKKFNAAYGNAAAPPGSTEQRNLPAKQAPSEEALKLLGMLYDLDRTALPIHNRAHLENDKPNMAVASVVLNFISLVRSCESDMAALGKVATIVYQVHLSMDGDQSQIRMTKTILDSLCQIP